MSASFADFTKGMKGKRCAVIGMGVSNIPLIRLLLSAGAEVLICDRKEEHDAATVEEFRARGAELLLLGHFPVNHPHDCTVWNIPACSDQLAPILTTVYAQLFAYYMAKMHGCDIDKPRNLAKSVTVE